MLVLVTDYLNVSDFYQTLFTSFSERMKVLVVIVIKNQKRFDVHVS